MGGESATQSQPEIVRFDRTERIVHALSAACVLTLFVTGAILYFPALSVRVGERLLILNIHVICGVVALLPLLFSLRTPWGRHLRRDVARLTQMTKSEWRWFRPSQREEIRLGKFNPGQKLNAVLSVSALVVLLASGLILRFPSYFSLTLREGATFVHDWFALALILLTLGHIGFALAHPASLRSMIKGGVSKEWARHYAPAWLQELSEKTALVK